MTASEEKAPGRKSSPVAVVGVGNDFRGDDAVGLEVARRVRRSVEGSLSVDIIEMPGYNTSLIDVWDGKDLVILVDATASGEPVGTVCRIDALSAPSPISLRLHRSTHAIDIASLIGLSRSLGRLPLELVVYGVEGGRFGQGEKPSPEVLRAAKEVVVRIVREIRDAACGSVQDAAGGRK